MDDATRRLIPGGMRPPGTATAPMLTAITARTTLPSSAGTFGIRSCRSSICARPMQRITVDRCIDFRPSLRVFFPRRRALEQTGGDVQHMLTMIKEALDFTARELDLMVAAFLPRGCEILD